MEFNEGHKIISIEHVEENPIEIDIENKAEQDKKFEKLNLLLHIKSKKASAEEKITIHRKICDFSDFLIKKYGKEIVKNIKLYHLVIGSTVENTVLFDTKDNEIEEFINTL